MSWRECRLGSSSVVSAPGIVAWARAGWVTDPVGMLRVVTQCWSGLSLFDAQALLSGDASYVVEPGDVVVFQVQEDEQ